MQNLLVFGRRHFPPGRFFDPTDLILKSYREKLRVLELRNVSGICFVLHVARVSVCFVNVKVIAHK